MSKPVLLQGAEVTDPAEPQPRFPGCFFTFSPTAPGFPIPPGGPCGPSAPGGPEGPLGPGGPGGPWERKGRQI